MLKFIKAVVIRKGQVSDGDVAAVKQAGITEGEIIGYIALNILINYFNTIAKRRSIFR